MPDDEDRIVLGHNGEDAEQEIIPPGQPVSTRRGEVKYRPEFAQQALKLCKFGLTDQELGEFFGVHRVTIVRWRSDYPDFATAVKLGKDEADDRVEQALYRRAVGYDFPTEKLFSYEGAISRADTVEHVQPSEKAQIFWLKNRRPDVWRDVQQLTGANGSPLIPRAAPTDAELARYYALIISQGAAAAGEEEETDNGS